MMIIATLLFRWPVNTPFPCCGAFLQFLDLLDFLLPEQRWVVLVCFDLPFLFQLFKKCFFPWEKEKAPSIFDEFSYVSFRFEFGIKWRFTCRIKTLELLEGSSRRPIFLQWHQNESFGHPGTHDISTLRGGESGRQTGKYFSFLVIYEIT